MRAAPLMTDAAHPILSVPWLLGLRWLGLGAMLVAGVLPPHSGVLLAAVAVGGLSNAVLSVRQRRGWRLSRGVLAATLALDCVLMTAAFAVSGGSGNPVTLLYVLPVAIGSLTLPSGASWGLLGLAAGCYASLFVLAPADLHAHDPEAMRLHLFGMYAGFVGTGATLVFAFGRLQAARRDLDARLAAARAVEERNQHLAGLATLAAGAAHELSTPLSTVLLVISELRRALTDPEVREDLDLAREELLRCEEILRDLSADIGVGGGELAALVSAQALAEGAVADLAGAESVKVTADSGAVCVPPRLVQQLIRRLLGNALRAAGAATLDVSTEAEVLRIAVDDEGPGMSPEILRRAGEPFNTTQEHAGGRGLGLYFVYSVVRQLGGEIKITSAPGEGTHIVVQLPSDPETS